MKCKFCDGSGKDYWCLNGKPYPCPVCGGTGKVVYPMMSMNGDEYTGEWEQHECESCNGTGKVPMTNEEWLEKASTEEKALFLARLYGHSRKINLPELLLRNVGTGEVMDVAEYIGKWLKEKHDDSVQG